MYSKLASDNVSTPSLAYCCFSLERPNFILAHLCFGFSTSSPLRALPYLHFLACLAPMASFDKAFQALRPKADGRMTCFKLTADPLVSTKHFQKALNDFVTDKGSTDLWALLCPPPPHQPDWKSKPCGEWILQCGSLLWDILSFAPNTKVVSSKVTSALRAMGTLTPPTLTCHRFHEDLAATIEKVDVALRILMAQIRTLRINIDHVCNRVVRGLGGDNGKRLMLLLGRVELPDDMLLDKMGYFVEEEYGPGEMGSVLGDILPAEPAGLPAAPCLALALLPRDRPKSRLAPPPDWGQIMRGTSKDIEEEDSAVKTPPSRFRTSLLGSPDIFQTQNTAQKDSKKDKKDSKEEVKKHSKKKDKKNSKEEVKKHSKEKVKKAIKKKNKKCRKVKNVKKIKETSPIEAEDPLIRKCRGQKPPLTLREFMRVASVPERVAFHSEWGCAKCAWQRCTPSCWKSKNMEAP